MEWSARRLLAVAASAGILSMLMLRSSAAMAAPLPVRVGVVLDLTSDAGRRSLTCISMALEDFYLKHPSYATRVELRFRDSRGDIVSAAYAGYFWYCLARSCRST
ncbi:hypothetical protein CFC21_096527 [Triticum aestivum]|uniref:Glutamate receptor n=3 Tax=Triticum TaxID=4564 RepID=A0A9R0Z596_TRITD|nr:hypothetical protein CFC21_096527 [Triticum aestivum]VAI71482.1 unnamed protein product [Triticum turgidum subsp. durum]